MTKTAIKKELDQQSIGGRFWNSIATIEDITVARVCWLDYQYRIVPKSTTFDEAKERAYKPIIAFRLQSDLINYIHDKVNNKN